MNIPIKVNLGMTWLILLLIQDTHRNIFFYRQNQLLETLLLTKLVIGNIFFYEIILFFTRKSTKIHLLT